VQYTVWSGDRQIGVTDLGFLYRERGSRTGWFYPSALGEPLMLEIVSPLIGHYVRHDRRGLDEPPEADDLARYAAYEQACQRAASWNLQLRREDGTLVPTESVGIRDVEALLACYPDEETWEDELEGAFDFDDDPSDAWKRHGEDEATAELRRSIEHDLELINGWIEEKSANQQWVPDDDSLPRYQIFVLLSDPTAIP
jgi:hypothetical protein